MKRLFVRFLNGCRLSLRNVSQCVPIPPIRHRQDSILIIGDDVWPCRSEWSAPLMDHFRKGFGHVIMEEQHANLWDAHPNVHIITPDASLMIPFPQTMIHYHNPIIADTRILLDTLTHHVGVRHIVLSSDHVPEPIMWRPGSRVLPPFLWLCSGRNASTYRTSPFIMGWYGAIWSNHAHHPDFRACTMFEMQSGRFIHQITNESVNRLVNPQ